jgi:hypothetical protein
MGRGHFRLLFALATGLVAFAALTGTAGAAQSCGSRVVADWRDGRIDGTYPVACYREALADLPEDVRVYSSAQADITRALQGQIRATSAPRSHGAGSTHGVSPLLVVAITAAFLVAAGSIAAAVR